MTGMANAMGARNTAGGLFKRLLFGPRAWPVVAFDRWSLTTGENNSKIVRSCKTGLKQQVVADNGGLKTQDLLHRTHTHKHFSVPADINRCWIATFHVGKLTTQ